MPNIWQNWFYLWCSTPLSHNSSAEIIENLTKIQKIEKTAKPVVEYTCNNFCCIFYGSISPQRQNLGSTRDLGTKRLGNRPWKKFQTMIEQAPTYQAQSIQALYYHLKHWIDEEASTYPSTILSSPISIDEQGQTCPNTLQHKQYPPPHSLTLQSTDHCPEKCRNWV